MFRRLISAAVVMAGLAASLVVPAAATDFPADTTPLVTWNMQGAGNEAQDGSKWTNTVQRLALQVPILMLQEVGPHPPRNSVAQPDQTFTTVDSQGGTHQFTVLHRTWTVDSGYRSAVPTREVYFLQSADDATNPRRIGGRVNNALVLTEAPDELIVVGNPVDAAGTRSVRGSATSGTSPCTACPAAAVTWTMLDAIDDRLETLGNQRGVTYHATIGGDFNVDPQVLADRTSFPPTMRIHGSGQATHQNGGELDYFVTTHFDHALTVTVRPEGNSDHRPVQSGLLNAAGTSPSPGASPSIDELRVMPTGDGITAGVHSTDDGGFRDYLNSILKGLTTVAVVGGTAAGLIFKRTDFVGELKNGKRGDPDHMGFDGKGIDDIKAESVPALQTLRPNLMTLVAGTADLAGGADGTATAGRMQSFLDAIHRASPTTTVLLGTLPPSTNPTYQARIDAYNSALRTMAYARIEGGARLVLVELGSVTPQDITNEVYPTDAGYRTIADAFAEASGSRSCSA